jgi:hypothetical protein
MLPVMGIAAKVARTITVEERLSICPIIADLPV